jgi:general stress protein 26
LKRLQTRCERIIENIDIDMKKEINRRNLENMISDFLKTQTTCVIATCSESIPRASTVEFFPVGLTIYILTEGGRKVENIKKNPRVSIALSAPLQDGKVSKDSRLAELPRSAEKAQNYSKRGLRLTRNARV